MNSREFDRLKNIHHAKMLATGERWWTLQGLLVDEAIASCSDFHDFQQAFIRVLGYCKAGFFSQLVPVSFSKGAVCFLCSQEIQGRLAASIEAFVPSKKLYFCRDCSMLYMANSLLMYASGEDPKFYNTSHQKRTIETIRKLAEPNCLICKVVKSLLGMNPERLRLTSATYCGDAFFNERRMTRVFLRLRGRA